jgi:hypothetical protein
MTGRCEAARGPLLLQTLSSPTLKEWGTRIVDTDGQGEPRPGPAPRTLRAVSPLSSSKAVAHKRPGPIPERGRGPIFSVLPKWWT